MYGKLYWLTELFLCAKRLILRSNEINQLMTTFDFKSPTDQTPSIGPTGWEELVSKEFLRISKLLGRPVGERYMTLKDSMELDGALGYVRPDGSPLKCRYCGNTQFEAYAHDYMENLLMEYSSKCTKCKKLAGHWNTGHWEI